MSSFGPGHFSPDGTQRPPPVSRTVVFLAVAAAVIGYLAYSEGRIGIEVLYLLVALVPSVILHEVAHGVVAKWFGDNTARDAGRLTLNPLRHLDAFGTFILPAFLALSGAQILGYAKPVPVNTVGMSKNQSLLVALSGPIVNLILVLAAVLLIKATAVLGPDSVILTALVYFGFMNVVLAVFNMIPIPPLDGSSLIERFLPYRYMDKYLAFRKWSFVLLLAIFLLLPGVFGAILDPFITLYAGAFE